MRFMILLKADKNTEAGVPAEHGTDCRYDEI